MCGNGKCLYYGCRLCLKYMKNPVVIYQRPECLCMNDIYAETCNDECCDAYAAETEGECDCAEKPTATRTTGYQL